MLKLEILRRAKRDCCRLELSCWPEALLQPRWILRLSLLENVGKFLSENNCIFLAYLVQVLLYIFEEPVGGFRKFRGLVAPFYSGFSSHSFLRFLSIRYYRTCSCLHPWFWDCFRGAFPFPSLYWLVHFNTNSTSFWAIDSSNMLR